MYRVELYGAVRLAVVDEGLSRHEAGRLPSLDENAAIRRSVSSALSRLLSAPQCPPILPRQPSHRPYAFNPEDQ